MNKRCKKKKNLNTLEKYKKTTTPKQCIALIQPSLNLSLCLEEKYKNMHAIKLKILEVKEVHPLLRRI